MNTNLQVEIGGLVLKNPVIVGSAGYTDDSSGMRRFIEKGYAAVVTKSTSKKPLVGSPPPRVFWYDPYKKTWLDGSEAHRNYGIEKMASAVKECKKLADDANCYIVGSVSFNTVEEAKYIARAFEQAGVSAIELDMICPNVGPHLGIDFATRGAYWADPKNPQRTIETLRAIKEAIDVPLWPKIPHNSLIQNDMILNEASADAFVYGGPRMPGLAIDVETGRPLLSGNAMLKIKNGIEFDPYSQPSLPATVLTTALLRYKTKKSLIPSGGIASGFDIIQAMMAGANAAEMCTAIYRDFDVINNALREIRWLMSKRGCASLSEIIGVATEYIPYKLMRTPAFFK